MMGMGSMEAVQKEKVMKPSRFQKKDKKKKKSMFLSKDKKY